MTRLNSVPSSLASNLSALEEEEALPSESAALVARLVSGADPWAPLREAPANCGPGAPSLLQRISERVSPLLQRGVEWLVQHQQQRELLLKPVPGADRSAIALPLGVGPAANARGVDVPRAPSPARSTILAIGAHPDDVEIGCGGTLALHAKRGDRVVVLTLSEGSQAGEPWRRRQESKIAAARLGAELVHCSLPDTKISEGPETIEAISRVIAQCSPDTVYVHSDSDRHQDHRNVYRAAVVATRSVPSVYCYQSPSATIDFKPRRFVSIDACLDQKLELIGIYGSQTSKGYLAPQLIEATARYWGRFVGEVVAEPFEVIRERIDL